jgi:CDP-6-deoxy-D-xylo-4-hexulose-3-dehydrase
MQTVMPGDIILFKGPGGQGATEQEQLGLAYEVEADELQALLILPVDEPGLCQLAELTMDDAPAGRMFSTDLAITDKSQVISAERVVSREGRISAEKLEIVLRNLTKRMAARYYDACIKDVESFTPGETYIRYSGRVYDSSEITAVVDSALDFWLTAGRFADEFEVGLARFLGVKHCSLANSGSSANLLALVALTSPTLGERRLKTGDEVITTACAFPTTVNPIIQNGLVPVFIDVALDTLNVVSDQIGEALSEKSKAIFLAHTLGNPFDIDRVKDIAEASGLWLIEDSCDALGSKYDGRYTGSFGHIGTFSFYPAHHVTTGEGGATVTDDPDLRKLIESFRDWGRDCWCEPGRDNTCGKRFASRMGSLPFGYDHKYIYSHIGYNLKITEMQAAIGVAQLKKLPDFIQSRNENWTILFDGLKKYEEFFILPRPTPNSIPSWFGFALTVRQGSPFSRNQIVNHLEKKKISTRMLFAGNLTRQPSFKDVQYRVVGGLENTDIVMNDTFWVGVYPGIGQAEIDYILSVFDDFIRSAI